MKRYVVALLLLTACGGESLVAPSAVNLTGTWLNTSSYSAMVLHFTDTGSTVMGTGSWSGSLGGAEELTFAGSRTAAGGLAGFLTCTNCSDYLGRAQVTSAAVTLESIDLTLKDGFVGQVRTVRFARYHAVIQ